MFKLSRTEWLRRFGYLSLAMVPIGCGDYADADVGEFAQLEEAVKSGTSSTAAGVVQVLRRGSLCTGTLLRNDVVLTAAHCVDPTPGNQVVQTVGGQTIAVRAVEEQPDINGLGMDVALLRLATPVTINGSSTDFTTLLYREDSAQLVGSSVQCIGFGIATCGVNNSGQQRQGTAVVQSVGAWRDLTLGEGPTNQLPVDGDSGGSCFTAAGRITHVNRTSTCQSNRGAAAGVDTTTGVRAERIGPWKDKVVAGWTHYLPIAGAVVPVPAL